MTAELNVLEAIARKEQELRARLLAARAKGDALVARSAEEADAFRASEDAAAAAEAEAWTKTQLDVITREAELE